MVICDYQFCQGEHTLPRSGKVRRNAVQEECYVSDKCNLFQSDDSQSVKRVVSTIGHNIPQLVETAAQNMLKDEFYACFTAPDGQVIALDRHAQFVMV